MTGLEERTDVMRPSPLSASQRVEMWHAAFAAVRRHFDLRSAREVSTPIRCLAPAIEPHIEPVRAAGQYLATSPELAMKRLLAAGSGDIYQIAHVFRGGETGPRHREEFHLVEWYRVGDHWPAMPDEVEVLVNELAHAVASVLGTEPRAPAQWRRCRFLDVLESTLAVRLRGDESFEELEPVLVAVRRRAEAALGLASNVADDAGELTGSETGTDMDAGHGRGWRDLAAWTELFTLWSELYLDPWLATIEDGVHLVDFPAPLAALAKVHGSVAHRFESYFNGYELANGYEELGDEVEQRSRFAAVNAYRASLGSAPLPLDEEFLASLREPGLPRCSGVAMGLERMLMCSAGITDLRELSPLDGSIAQR